MLKKLVNEAHFTLRITTTGPLLVKSGHDSISGPNMSPVLTWRNKQPEAFLPGSSLKGVFRSSIEKIVCSLSPRVVCYPFKDNPHGSDYRNSCGEWFNQYAHRSEQDRKRLEQHTDLVYEASCPTCRLFGSTAYIGRIAISDAYLASQDLREQRDGVGIDRLTGGASNGAKFELEVVSAGVSFDTEVHLRNFEIWQLGMLLVIVQDMEDELIPLGSGRSRGLGKVKAAIREEGKQDRPGGLVISTLRYSKEEEQPDKKQPDREQPNEVWGLGRWLNDSSYGTTPEDRLELSEAVAREDRGIRSTRSFTGAALTDLRARAIKEFLDRMQNWPANPTDRLDKMSAGQPVGSAARERRAP